MPTLTITLPKLHPGQQRIKAERRRFNVLNCGRRFGKNVLQHDVAIEAALALGGPVGWFSPTYKMMLEDWRTLTNVLAPVTRRANMTERRIELITDGMIEFWSMDNVNVGRGRKYRRVIVNEAAMIAHLAETWEQAVRPTLTDLEGDAYFDSTPKGQNYFYQLYNRGLEDGDWVSWTMPTAANPHIKPSEIEAARQELPELTFRQEYLAEFLQNEGAVFRNIPACMGAPQTNPAEHSGHRLMAGVDWGKHRDFTAISVGCATCRVEVARDRFNQIDYAFQRGRLRALVDPWKVHVILAESNAMGEPIIEELHREGLRVRPFQTTATTKPPLIESLALALEREEWQFQADPVWTGELEAYERTVSPATGRSQYSAPEGLHDDTVIARALMVEAGGMSPTGGIYV